MFIITAKMMTHIISTFSPGVAQNSNVIALETSLQQTLLNFRELLVNFEQLHIESNNYKAEIRTQKDSCENKLCNGAEQLKKVIQQKDDVIQLAASTLTRLSETKNWSILEEVFKILFGETTTEPQNIIKHEENTKVKEENITKVKEELVSQRKTLESSVEDVSFKDDSVSEIEGTPTGRVSPIIQTRKIKSNVATTLDKIKKKHSEGAPTENKQLKLCFTPTQTKKCKNLRQSRLNIVKVPTKTIIDITSSPGFSGGCRSNSDYMECHVQKIVNKESLENDDTILPSPTSGPTEFTLYKSPVKFKKPQLRLKCRAEKSSGILKQSEKDTEKKIMKREWKDSSDDTNINMNDLENCNSVTYTQEDSINILHPDRYKNLIKSSPLKQKECDITTSPIKQSNKMYNTESSISILQNVDKLRDLHENIKLSPSKRPLGDNINVTNIVEEEELQASMSLLPRDATLRLANENCKRRLVESVELYLGTNPRTRAEKRQLPGWACEKCINFFSELHKDDPEMMWKKINQCSHHRGMNNPERPKTPPGYWNPRWNVPDDTDEFNRKNNI